MTLGRTFRKSMRIACASKSYARIPSHTTARKLPKHSTDAHLNLRHWCRWYILPTVVVVLCYKQCDRIELEEELRTTRKPPKPSFLASLHLELLFFEPWANGVPRYFWSDSLHPSASMKYSIWPSQTDVRVSRKFFRQPPEEEFSVLNHRKLGQPYCICKTPLLAEVATSIIDLSQEDRS